MGVDIQIFTAVGSNTWTKPTGAQTTEVFLIGAGGSGGSGRCAALGGVGGGGGAQGGGISRMLFLSSIWGRPKQ